MKPSEIRQILAAEGIRLTKSLGQVFLHDVHQLERIVHAANLSAEDRVLEIGPGLGPLTESLAGKAKEVLAIEKDRRLYEILKQRFTSAPNLQLVHADALEYLPQQTRDWSEWKMVSNLPYSVASPILVELAQLPNPPKLLVATLQLEVARRLTAAHGSRDYGILTLLVQLRYVPLGSFKIPPGCFFPEPEIDSACLTLQRREQPLLAPELTPLFTRIVKRGFSQRRKMMFKLLKEDWPANLLQKAFEELGLDLHIRAEAVSLEQFIGLTKLCKSLFENPPGRGTGPTGNPALARKL